MPDNKPIMVRENLRDDLRYALEGSLDEAIKLLTDLREQIPEEHRSSAEIEIEANYGYCDSVSVDISVHYLRPETDAEREARLAQGQQYMQQIRQRELAELERLRAKYGA